MTRSHSDKQTSRRTTSQRKTSQRNSSSLRVKRLTTSAMLTAVALIFAYIEAIIPFSVGVPGVKLGLANLVILIALYEMNFRYAMAVNLLRIFLSSLLFNSIFAMLYSLAGGVLSLIVMALLKRTGKFSMIGVSMAGSVTHNFGQILVASFVVSNLRMFLYFPILVFSGIAAGIAIGFVAVILDARLPKSLFQ
ncbi:MAG: Gx transporter family protein [Anaerovoracaceae bacterium]|jgi:heptaprenyl diphosphate synthase